MHQHVWNQERKHYLLQYKSGQKQALLTYKVLKIYPIAYIFLI